VIRCWGYSSYGEVGTRSTRFETAPVPNLAHVKDLAVGSRHACALLGDGSVSCWGDGSVGQLGPGVGSSVSEAAVSVSAVRDGVSIASHETETCVARKTFGVSCWGGAFRARAPVSVPGLAGAVEVAIRGEYGETYRVDADGTRAGDVCGRLSDGRVRCAEFRFSPSSAAERPPSFGASKTVLTGIQHVTGGGGEVCGVHADGGVTCWDGHAMTLDRVRVDHTVSVGVGLFDSCSVGADRRVRCWHWELPVPRGNNPEFEPPRPYRPEPKVVEGIGNAAAVAVGSYSCALLEGGRAQCWEPDEHGPAALGIIVGGVTRAIRIVVGTEGRMCVLLQDETVRCGSPRDAPPIVPSPAIVEWRQALPQSADQVPVAH
jgi:hypothetical protein